MRQWIGSALVQIMACRLFGAKPLSNPIWFIVNWALRSRLQWKFNQNKKLIIHEIASASVVCEMAAILSRGRWDKMWNNNECFPLCQTLIYKQLFLYTTNYADFDIVCMYFRTFPFALMVTCYSCVLNVSYIYIYIYGNKYGHSDDVRASNSCLDYE